jgi:hypothetical protein
MGSSEVIGIIIYVLVRLKKIKEFNTYMHGPRAGWNWLSSASPMGENRF